MASTLTTSNSTSARAERPRAEWSRELERDLDAAVLSRDPPDRAEFQGRMCRFFFVTGIGKSGTNWLANVLNLHPSVYVDRAEFHFESLWNQTLPALCEYWWQACHGEPYNGAVHTGMHDVVRRTMLAGVGNKPEAVLIGDKSPRPFRVLLPGCPIIHIMRDGRDVVVSSTFHHLRLRPEYIQFWPEKVRDGFMPYAHRFQADPANGRDVAAELLTQRWWLDFITARWTRCMAADREAIDATDRDDPGTPVMTLRYEHLHSHFDDARTELYDFLGVDPALAAAPSGQSRTSPGFSRENVESFYRKGQPGDWKNYRNETFDEVVKAVAGDVLVRERYEEDTAW